MADDTAAAAPAATTTDTGAASQGGPSDSGAQAAAPAAPEFNWRQAIAGDNKDYQKQLERFTDPGALGRAYFEAQNKIRSGELKAAPQPFPDKGTPEAQAQWRAEQGIPPDPKGYKVELPEGQVLGEADKAGVERLTALAHKNNWSPKQVNDIMAAYYHEMDASRAEREAADAQHHQESDDLLRNEWKGDYRANLQAVNNMLDGAPKEVKDRLLGGRTADGKLIANDPAMLKWLASTARELNPAATMLPSGTANMTGVGTELDRIRGLIKDRSSEYYKGPNSQKLQDRYKELLDAESRMKTRAA